LVSKAAAKAAAKSSRERLIPALNPKSVLADALMLSFARRLPNFMSSLGLGKYQNAADMMVAGTGKKILTGQGGSALFKVGVASAGSNLVEDVFTLVRTMLSNRGVGASSVPAIGPQASSGLVVSGRVSQD